MVFLVILNSVISLLFTLDFLKRAEGFWGITLGLLTFVFFFMYIDNFLIRKGKEVWRRALFGAVLTRSLLQLIPFIDIIAGLVATELSSKVLGKNVLDVQIPQFWNLYITTVIDGFVLSLMVVFLMLFFRIISHVRQDEIVTYE